MVSITVKRQVRQGDHRYDIDPARGPAEHTRQTLGEAELTKETKPAFVGGGDLKQVT